MLSICGHGFFTTKRCHGLWPEGSCKQPSRHAADMRPRFVFAPAVLRRTLVPTQHLVHKLQSTHEKDNNQGFLSPLTVRT